MNPDVIPLNQMSRQNVIDAAKLAHRTHWQTPDSVGDGDRLASAVTKAWQAAVASDSIEAEVSVGEVLNERIDVVDHDELTAYELKVSGNNPQHEFYKDLFKIWAYNRNYQPKLKRFVFMTEQRGIDRLSQGLANTVREGSFDLLGLTIEFVGI